MRQLLAGMALMALSMGMAGLALPLYAKELGASYTEIGMLGVAYVIFMVLFSVPVGSAGDRRGRKPLLVLGFILTACVLALYSLVDVVIWLIALRFLQGATEAPIWVNAQSAIADLSGRGERGRAMGTYGTSWAVGFATGPLLGGALYVAIGPAQTFLLSALVAFIATALIAGMSLPKPKLVARKLQFSSIWPACFVGLIYVGIVSVIFTLFPAYATSTDGLDIPTVEVGFLITLFAGVRGVLFVPMGSLSDRIGHRSAILAGIFGSAFALAGIALLSSYLALAAIICILAAAEGAVYPAVMSMISKAGEGENLGYVIGIFNGVSMVGWGLFPGVGGALADVYGPTSPYLMCAVVALVASVLFWKLLPKKEEEVVPGAGIEPATSRFPIIQQVSTHGPAQGYESGATNH